MLVVDASAMLALLLSEDAARDLADVETGLVTGQAHAPDLLSHEITNSLIMASRRGRIGDGQLLAALRAFSALPLQWDRADSFQQRTAIVVLAERYRLSAYDAAYLELATRLGVPLASLDQRLRAACVTAGGKVMP